MLGLLTNATPGHTTTEINYVTQIFSLWFHFIHFTKIYFLSSHVCLFEALKSESALSFSVTLFECSNLLTYLTHLFLEIISVKLELCPFLMKIIFQGLDFRQRGLDGMEISLLLNYILII